ncbi:MULTISPECIES: hypothetical protein [Acinetobacter calcoaceticus/baumannii complex]|uniref:hypothetical protein n=1 Tax=Acinetobacter calcoaceticus/baumannii complex TaxID=909768 RepID=UPI000B1BC826|nr:MULTISPECIES: hypothetical protein [Acinetobacter calcoaceticus/baumannii complex]
MAGILTPDDFKNIQRDLRDTGKGVNEDVIVKPRYGLPFKSLPMLSRLFEEMLASGYVTIDDLQEAINIALAGGAGAAGWTTDLVADGSETQKLINDKTTQNVPNVESLKALIVRKNGQRVLVNNRYVYEYKSQAEDTTDDIYSILPSNNVGRWILQKPVSLFASDFANTSDISQNSQSLKLQQVNDISVRFSVPFIVDAEFMLAPVESDHNICFYVRSNNDITFTPKGNFKIIPNDFTTYSILHIENIENYKVLFPQITGDRDQHLGTEGEWGYGIANYQSRKGYIYRPKVTNTWGDGIYVGRRWGLITDDTPTDITISEPTVLNAGRNGISLSAGTRVNILLPYIYGTKGKAPEAGIDIEPEAAAGLPKSHLKDCIISSPTIENCKIGLVGYFFPNDSTYEIEISGVTTIKSCEQPLVLCAGGANNQGYIDINKLVLSDLKGNTLLQNAWHRSGGLRCTVKELVTDKSLPIVLTMNGAFSTGKLGHFDVRKIINNDPVGKIGYYVPTSVQNYEDNSTYMFEDPNRAYLDFDFTTHFFGKDFLSNIVTLHTGWTASSRNMSNIIWQDPSIDTSGNSAIYIATNNDYRRLKIGLANTTTIVGQGCNISGLRIRKADGSYYTEAHTQFIGAWLDFQNNLNGNTEVFGSYGSWSFT